MSTTRRSFLGTGLLGLSAGLAACGAAGSGQGGGRTAGGRALTLWYWGGGLSDRAVKEVTASFAPRGAITAKVLDGDFKQQLTTALSARRSVPDITGVKGEDMALFLGQAQHFLDLNALGARTIAGTFAAAKYAQATTTDGRQLGLPIDLGPTALFLRADLWAKAGLPTEPGVVSSMMQTWDGWFAAARRLKKALPGTFAIRNSSDVFTVALAQQPETFIARDGTFVGAGGGVRRAWELAVRSISEGVQAGIYDGSAFNAALAAGRLTGQIGPAWNGLDIEAGAPRTAGAWRVASAPGGPANIGGSFLTLTDACRNPELAFAFISELLSPANQGKGFTDAALFPSVVAAYTLPALTRGQAFYGGQATIEVFGPAAENLPRVYESPLDAAVSAAYVTELANVEGGKNPATAWRDAVAAGTQAAQA